MHFNIRVFKVNDFAVTVYKFSFPRKDLRYKKEGPDFRILITRNIDIFPTIKSALLLSVCVYKLHV